MKTYEQGYKEGTTESISNLTKVLTDLALADGRRSTVGFGGVRGDPLRNRPVAFFGNGPVV